MTFNEAGLLLLWMGTTVAGYYMGRSDARLDRLPTMSTDNAMPWCPDCRQSTAGRCAAHSSFIVATGGYVPSREQDLELQLSAALAARQEAEQARDTYRSSQACRCDHPDPVMQADGKFYCYTCSFQTGARPTFLEPESTIRAADQARAEAEQQRDESREAAIEAQKAASDWRTFHVEAEQRVRRAIEIATIQDWSDDDELLAEMKALTIALFPVPGADADAKLAEAEQRVRALTDENKELLTRIGQLAVGSPPQHASTDREGS
jgi:hypothetical protein